MSADNFTATLNLQYTPPGAPVNSGVAALAIGGTYQAGQAGSIVVPPGTTVATVIPVPFGSVSKAKLFVVKNGLSADLGVRLKGAVTNTFNLPPGGIFSYEAPVAPAAIPLTQVDLVTTVDPTVTERTLYWAFGD